MRLVALELSSVDIPSEGSVQATVRLDSEAPATGMPILLGSSDEAIKVPSRVVVPAGQLAYSFTIEAGSLRYLEEYQVWAQLAEVVCRQRLVFRLPGLAELYFNPAVVAGGGDVTLTAVLDNPAPVTGALVNLSEDPSFGGESVPLITDLPPSIYFAAGDTESSISVTTRNWDAGRIPPPRQVDTAVDAIYGDATKRAILTITDP